MTTRQRILIWLLQPLLLLATVAASATSFEDLVCLYCLCYGRCPSGSDHTCTAPASATTTLSLAPGVMNRWHDMTFDLPSPQRLEAKDLAFVRGWLPGNVIIGIKIPTAPGATQPGTIKESHLRLFLQRQGGGTINMTIPLTVRDDLSQRIAQVFPPETGSHWQALVPTDDSYISLIPTTATTFTSSSGWLYYAVDFHGTDVCNGCRIDLTVGTPARFPPDLRLAARLLPSGLRLQSGAGLTLAEPISTIISIGAEGGQPAPAAQPTAWLSAWGGPAFASTDAATVRLDYTLGHNVAGQQTFQLDPIQSDLGWSYQWQNLSGQPISQITLPTTPTGMDGWPANLRIVGNVPTGCRTAVDTIHITARSLTNPALRATNVAVIRSLPNPAQCATADLGVSQTASHSAIDGGQTVIFTLQVTNYESVVKSGVLTDTLEPAAAIGGLNLPPECTRVGDKVVCQVRDLPAGGRRTLTFGVQTAPRFGGTLDNWVTLVPAQAVDLHGYDNVAGPLSVAVTGAPGSLPVFLPLVLRN